MNITIAEDIPTVVYDFKECVDSVKVYNSEAMPLIRDYFGAETITKATLQDDKNGTDYTVSNSNGLSQNIDIKCLKRKKYSKNEILIEFAHRDYGDGGLRKLGWTFLENKNTDWIIYYYPLDKRIRVIPFITLRKLSILKKDEWIKKYGLGEAKNKYYYTEFLYLQIKDYVRALYETLKT